MCMRSFFALMFLACQSDKLEQSEAEASGELESGQTDTGGVSNPLSLVSEWASRRPTVLKSIFCYLVGSCDHDADLATMFDGSRLFGRTVLTTWVWLTPTCGWTLLQCLYPSR